MAEQTSVSPAREDEGHERSALGTLTWMAPLLWLEQILPGSPVLKDIRRSLPHPSLETRSATKQSHPLLPKPQIPASPLSQMEGNTKATWEGEVTVDRIVAPEEKNPDSTGFLEILKAIAFVSLEEKSPPLKEMEDTRHTPVSVAQSLGFPLEAGEPSTVRGASYVLENSGDPVIPISMGALNSPPHFPEAGLSSVLEQEAGIGTPVSVAFGESQQSDSGFPVGDGGPFLDPKTPVCPASASFPGTLMSPPGLLNVGVTGSPEKSNPVLETRGPNCGPISGSSVASWGSPGSPQKGQDSSSPMEGDPNSQQDVCTGVPISVPHGATQVSPTSQEDAVNACFEQGASGLGEAQVSLSSVGSVDILSSPRGLLDADVDVSPVEKSPPFQPEFTTQGTEASPWRIGAPLEFSGAIVPPGLEEKPLLAPLEKCTSTPLSMAQVATWTDLPNLPDITVLRAEKALSEENHVLGCQCHGFWSSPLSLLDAGSSECPESIPATSPGKTGTRGSTLFLPSMEAWQHPPADRTNSASIRFQDKGVGVTPVSVASAAAWMSLPVLVEASMNTSAEEKVVTKESTAETDSLLWHCSRDQLQGLSRTELEGRLESTLIIMEALSYQMRACQNFQGLDRHRAGPADQREVSTQTPILDPKQEEQFYRNLYIGLQRRFQALQRSRESEQELSQRLASALNEMRDWSPHTAELLGTVYRAFEQIQEDRRSLDQQEQRMRDLIFQCQSKIRSSRQRETEMKGKMEEALKMEGAVDITLESVRSHAMARIERLEESIVSQQQLQILLQEANEYKGDLMESRKCLEEGDRQVETLQLHWAQMRLDYKAFRTLTSQYQLAMGRMEEEVRAVREETAQHQEVCQKLKERTKEVVAALGRVNELVKENAGLEKVLKTAQQLRTEAEGEKDQLHREMEDLAEQLVEKEDTIWRLKEETARLSSEKEKAEKERDAAQQEAREMSDCREFMEQENQIARRQLKENEEELKATLATLRERSTRLGDLEDTQRMLQEEWEGLRRELASAEAEIRTSKAHSEAFARFLPLIGAVQAEFLEIADSLRATALLQDQVAEEVLWNSYTPARRTPHHLKTSFVDSVLKAVAEKGSKTLGVWSENKAFTKPILLTPPEVQDNFASCICDLQELAAQIRLLSSQHQEAAREEVRSLQAKIGQLQERLEDLDGQIRTEKESRAAETAKLNKTLQLRLQNEKDLQEALKRQEERLSTLIDQSSEITILQEELSQLKYALKKSETETLVLREELLRGGTKKSDADWVEEKIWLRQEVGKLRDLLIQKDDQRAELQTSYLCQVRQLEAHLHQAKQLLRKREKSVVELKEVLATLPLDVAGLYEVQRLCSLLL